MFTHCKVKVFQSFGCVQLFATPWTVALKAPLSVEFCRQKYWSGPFPSPGNLPNPGIKCESPALQADSLLGSILQGKFITTGPPGKSRNIFFTYLSSLYSLFCEEQWLQVGWLEEAPLRVGAGGALGEKHLGRGSPDGSLLIILGPVVAGAEATQEQQAKTGSSFRQRGALFTSPSKSSSISPTLLT